MATVARQMLHGNAIDGKSFFVVRLANVARQRLLLCCVSNMFYLKKNLKQVGL
jgi:hypothetical protein